MSVGLLQLMVPLYTLCTFVMYFHVKERCPASVYLVTVSVYVPVQWPDDDIHLKAKLTAKL